MLEVYCKAIIKTNIEPRTLNFEHKKCHPILPTLKGASSRAELNGW